VRIKVPSLLAGFALAGTLLLTTVGAAAAVTPPGGPSGKSVCATQLAAVKAGATVDTLRALGNCEIARRLTTLDALSAKVTASKRLSTADAATLQGVISSAKSGLAALKTAIDTETDLTALKADVAKVATDFRVYVLVARQVNLVNAADGVLAAQAKFATINTKLAERIATAKAAGKDTAAAETALAAMNTSVANAIALAQPLPAQLLALTPAQFNAGTAGPILDSARTKLGQARDQLKAAAASAKACRDALK
jgi:hypothetical protein